MDAFQLAQARLIEEPRRVVGRHQPLGGTQHRGAGISVESHFIADEIGVAKGLQANTRDVLQRGLEDERRH